MSPRRGTGRPWPVALVTGASSGIGEAFAHRLAASGSDLVLVARRPERLEAVAHALRSEHGRAVEVLAADLAAADDLGRVEARLADDERPVDLLVNNAGFGTQGAFATLAVEGEDQEIRVNVLAPVRLARAVLPGMLARRRGGIVNVSSLAALQPIPHWATYAATKAFLTSFGEALREEVGGQGVRVLTLMPGFVRTDFQARAGFGSLASAIAGPLWMEADDVAQAALQALARGRSECVPGLGYRAFAMATRLTPWAVSRRVARLVTARR